MKFYTIKLCYSNFLDKLKKPCNRNLRNGKQHKTRDYCSQKMRWGINFKLHNNSHISLLTQMAQPKYRLPTSGDLKKIANNMYNTKQVGILSYLMLNTGNLLLCRANAFRHEILPCILKLYGVYQRPTEIGWDTREVCIHIYIQLYS